MSELTWFKSSYSGSDGDSCLEVALTWFKSSYSGSEGDSCVEVAKRPESVLVRDSKDSAGPQLSLSPAAWNAFVSYAGVHV